MTSSPKVVALLPARNSVGLIEATLESLAAQTYPNLEIRIGDDASDDGTGLVCRRFAESEPRCRVVTRTTRLGWVENSNALLEEADGDYVFFMADDDEVAPTYVERLVQQLHTNPDAVLAFSDIEFVGPGVRGVYAALDGVTDPFERVRLLLRWDGLEHVPYRGVVRLSTVHRVGGLRRHRGGELGADWDWLLRLAPHGEFVRLPQQLYRKIYREGSTSHGWRHPNLGHAGLRLAMIGSIIQMRDFTRRQRARLVLGLVLESCGKIVSAMRRRLGGRTRSPDVSGGS